MTHPTTRFTLWRLYLGYNYTINVSAAVTFRNYYGGNCYFRYLYGEDSNTLTFEPKETGKMWSNVVGYALVYYLPYLFKKPRTHNLAIVVSPPCELNREFFYIHILYMFVTGTVHTGNVIRASNFACALPLVNDA